MKAPSIRLRLFFSFFSIGILSSPSSQAQSTDISGAIYTLLKNDRAALEDDSEHNLCPGPQWSANSCRDTDPTGQSLVHLSTEKSHSGSWSYKLPAPLPTGWPPLPDQAISSGKMEASYVKLHSYTHAGKTSKFTAHYYIASGFDDTPSASIKPWHIQMQWKIVDPTRSGNDRYWTGNPNPKIAIGFNNRISNGSAVRQITATIRDSTPGLCKWSFDEFTRTSTLNQNPIPAPTEQWIKVTTEIKFDAEHGYIKVWQGDPLNDSNLVIHKPNINTLSQLVTPANAKLDPNKGAIDTACTAENGAIYYRTTNTAFDFGITNYLGSSSYAPDVRQNNAPHLLYVDDIFVYR